MKKMALLGLVLSLTLLFGCSTAPDSAAEGKLNVVTSFYPIYHFTTMIGGEFVHATHLIPMGVEPHDWTPKSRDLVNLSKAQLFLYNGAGFEGWVPTLINGIKAQSKQLIVAEVSRGIPLIRVDSNGNEYTVEPDHSEDPDDPDHSDHSDSAGHSDHRSDIDPHTWVSPLSAMKMAENIKESLIEADPEHRAHYEANFVMYHAQLQTLHEQFAQQLANVKRKEIIVTHRSFGYLCRDYGLIQLPIMGLSPDAEPAARDMKQIADFIKDNDVKTIFFEQFVSDRLAKTFARDLGVDMLVLNPLEGLTSEQIAAGDDYISVMKQNLQNLIQALQ